MSYINSNSAFEPRLFADEQQPRFVGEPASQPGGHDLAIDAALKSVPLPRGLMSRLGKLAYTVPEETADQVDWLGC